MPPFLHTASDQKLEAEMAWEQDYVVLITGFAIGSLSLVQDHV